MKTKTKAGLIVAATLLLGLVCFAQKHSNEVLWRDFDMKSIPEPKERTSGYYEYFFKGQVIEGAKQDLDVARWVRIIGGHPKRASNVNALDEVPDSSWYTNRHYRHRMSAQELKRGPNSGLPPDFSSAVITKAKPSGVTPGMMVKDAAGEAYLVKFDSSNYPNLQSGAEVISTKILYAAGYNVPENYVAYLDPHHLKIGDKVEITDSRTGRKRQLTQDDVDEMLRRVARTPDGRCRVLASKLLKGKAKGPFPQVGMRSDDPNDLIPHENRRELRGLRVIASWINDWDLKEPQSMDMYVEEGGRKFLRHYLLDFGSSLGADDQPTDYYHGHEYGLDLRSITKEILSLGIYESANEKTARIISSEIGNFTSDEFHPGTWKQTYPSAMFDNLTDADAFWATRVILSFSEDDLRNIIETGEYSDLKTKPYILRTLMERRQILARYWLGRTDALADFGLERATDGVTVHFRDLMVDNQPALPQVTTYTYEVKAPRYKSSKKTTDRPEFTIGREVLAAAKENASADAPIEVNIWTHRQDFTSNPVTLYFDWSPNRETFAIRKISRS
jgi:hypothetical protein